MLRIRLIEENGIKKWDKVERKKEKTNYEALISDFILSDKKN